MSTSKNKYKLPCHVCGLYTTGRCRKCLAYCYCSKECRKYDLLEHDKICVEYDNTQENLEYYLYDRFECRSGKLEITAPIAEGTPSWNVDMVSPPGIDRDHLTDDLVAEWKAMSKFEAARWIRAYREKKLRVSNQTRALYA